MLNVELICHFWGFQLTLMFGSEFGFFSKDLMLVNNTNTILTSISCHMPPDILME
jgi:hypothetical protein